ncbi:MAG: DUF5106 domain-containing protein [Prevotella sp.]|nr:DUF5106 domain-containing protein [Prevotella sp.]
MEKVVILFLFCLLVGPFAMLGKGQVLTKESVKDKETGFPYPSIPESLRSVSERTDYLLAHYWDNYAFQDTALVHQPQTEQGLVNFLDLLERIDSKTATAAVQHFMSDTEKAPDVSRNYFSAQLEHYLYDPESPMHNTDLYLSFLQSLMHFPHLSETDLSKLSFQFDNVKKNKCGDQASDFVYENRSGIKHTLYDTKGDYILLFFYDPDCENCHRATAELKKMRLLANPKIKVLAVYPDEDTEKWEKGRGLIPDSWIDARSPGGEVFKKSIYFIQAMPTIYLLDKSKKVILKDCSPAKLDKQLQQIFG